jgi:phosphopantothenoylcysteine decarboxylase/phosphopantothenate--cysteine ligase
VRTAAEMESAVLNTCQQADVLLMAAAVADFRPVQTVVQKIKKRSGLSSIGLEPTPDILSAVAEQRTDTKHPRIVVGFAAETQDLLANAEQKRKSKRLDLIVANDVSTSGSGFGSDTNKVTFIQADGQIVPLPMQSKQEVADRVIDEVIFLLTKLT